MHVCVSLRLRLYVSVCIILMQCLLPAITMIGQPYALSYVFPVYQTSFFHSYFDISRIFIEI